MKPGLPTADSVIVQGQRKDESKTFSNTILPDDLIYGVVFDFCSPTSFLRVSRTSRSAHMAVRTYMQKAFSINRILSRFFNSPLEFRRVQAETDTLISGSSILQLFDRSFYPGSDLDIYTCQDSDLQLIASFLLTEGYEYVPDQDQNDDFEKALLDARIDDGLEARSGAGHELLAVFTFENRASCKDPLRVELVMTHHHPFEIILEFHSSKSKQVSLTVV